MANPDPNSPAPFGTQPRRSMLPFLLLVLLWVGWFAFLIGMAIRFPARG